MKFENLPEKTSENLPEKKKSNFDIETFKSIYYWANAKPDTQIKLFKEKKELSISDIFDLNNRVSEKLKTHSIETFITSLNFVLTEGNLREYSSWGEFERENWDYINQKTLSISIIWDLTFALPNYTIPQRHTLRVKIGNAIPPKDIFHLMFTSDEIGELIQSQAEGVVKVDFINQVLGNELINIVNNWHEGLKNIKKKNNTQNFLEKNDGKFRKILQYLLPIFLLYIGFIYQNLIFKELDISKILNLVTLERTLLIGASIISLGLLLSRLLANLMTEKINKLKTHNGILITKGDKNYSEEIKNENKSIIRDIFQNVIVSLIVSLIIIAFKYLFSYFNS